MQCPTSGWGPLFGFGDLYIGNNSNTTASSKSNLGITYDNLGITKDLIGEGNKLIEEIEVFTVKWIGNFKAKI